MATSQSFSEATVLEKLYPLLQSSLSVDEVKPFLVQGGVLTLDQCDELRQCAQTSTARGVAERALLMMSRHPQCATQLLTALERTESAGYPSSGHYQIIAQLKEQLGLLHIKDGDSYKGEPVPLIDYGRLQKNSGSSEKLRVRLALESTRMLEHFAAFSFHVGNLLQGSGVMADEVRTLLQFRLGSKNIGEESMKHVREGKTIHNLLCAAEPFSSWFNYDLVAFLAKELGGEKGLTAVAEYESKLKQYLERLVYECPPFSSIKSVPSGFEELEVKLDWNFERVTIQDITIFKAKLCEFLDKSDPAIFILKSVEEGCVRLTWLVPLSIVQELMAFTTGAQGLLNAYAEITSIRLGPKIFDRQCAGATSRPFLLTLHENDEIRDENMDQLEHAQDSTLQVQLPESRKVTSPLMSLTSDKTLHANKGEPTLCTVPTVRLRDKKSPRQKRNFEKRLSSGYYSPFQSVIFESPNNSRRSSLVLDSTGRVSVHSSGYNSPTNSKRSSAVQLDEEEECEPHSKLQRTPSTETSFSSPVADRSESPLIANKVTFTRQKSSDSNN